MIPIISTKILMILIEYQVLFDVLLGWDIVIRLII